MKTGPSPFTNRQLKRAFWSKVRKGSGCWIWTGASMKNGYGMFHVHRKCVTAHRFIYMRSRKVSVPSSMDVCHKCDNRLCVRPSHLYVGTRKVNMEDAKNKGRVAFGERQGRSVLTDLKVIEMRGLYSSGGYSMECLSKRFGCSLGTAFNAIRNKSWTHI